MTPMLQGRAFLAADASWNLLSKEHLFNLLKLWIRKPCPGEGMLWEDSDGEGPLLRGPARQAFHPGRYFLCGSSSASVWGLRSLGADVFRLKAFAKVSYLWCRPDTT